MTKYELMEIISELSDRLELLESELYDDDSDEEYYYDENEYDDIFDDEQELEESLKSDREAEYERHLNFTKKIEKLAADKIRQAKNQGHKILHLNLDRNDPMLKLKMRVIKRAMEKNVKALPKETLSQYANHYKVAHLPIERQHELIAKRNLADMLKQHGAGAMLPNGLGHKRHILITGNAKKTVDGLKNVANNGMIHKSEKHYNKLNAVYNPTGDKRDIDLFNRTIKAVAKNHEMDEFRAARGKTNEELAANVTTRMQKNLGHLDSSVLKKEGRIVNHRDMHPAVKRIFNHLRKGERYIPQYKMRVPSEEKSYGIKYK
jgi:hypothetical protein